MTLQQLRALVSVASYGSFRAAARHLVTSQPGLTKSIARLESEFHVRLLARTPQGVELTAEGGEFLRRARAILEEIERAEDMLRTAGATQASVACSDRAGLSRCKPDCSQ